MIHTRQMTKIAFMGASMICVFRLCADILYLELITFTIVLYASVFKRNETILACVVFAALNICLTGLTPWSLLYMMVYPTYAWILSHMKPLFSRYPFTLYLTCGILSFLTGQILDLPFLLFGKHITIAYWLMGLKTSLIQGFCSFLACLLLYDPLYRRLSQIQTKSMR